MSQPHERGHAARLWTLSLITGAATGYGVIVFLQAIALAHDLWLGARIEALASAAAAAPGWRVMAGPVLAGLLAGLALRFLPPENRPLGIAEVMEAGGAADPRMKPGAGLLNALYAALSLGGGASAGREGPAIHLGASLAAALARLTRLPPHDGRLILACGAAAAVAASFNAPIAGMLFAHEIILRRFALAFMPPLAIAATAGAVVSRLHLGDFPAFVLPPYEIATYAELPGFALLGLLCAGVAILFIQCLRAALALAARARLPVFVYPVAAGFLVGCLALAAPEILGVGYETTDSALKQNLPLALLLALIPLKILATAITLAGRFGGGVFSPALYLGAMTGSVFGLGAAALAPQAAGLFGGLAGLAPDQVPAMVSGHGLYAIAGMGAVAAAVLGAPISTLLIVFELIGDAGVTIALMLPVIIATALTRSVLGNGYLRMQAQALREARR